MPMAGVAGLISYWRCIAGDLVNKLLMLLMRVLVVLLLMWLLRLLLMAEAQLRLLRMRVMRIRNRVGIVAVTGGGIRMQLHFVVAQMIGSARMIVRMMAVVHVVQVCVAEAAIRIDDVIDWRRWRSSMMRMMMMMRNVVM